MSVRVRWKHKACYSTPTIRVLYFIILYCILLYVDYSACLYALTFIYSIIYSRAGLWDAAGDLFASSGNFLLAVDCFRHAMDPPSQPTPSHSTPTSTSSSREVEHQDQEKIKNNQNYTLFDIHSAQGRANKAALWLSLGQALFCVNEVKYLPTLPNPTLHTSPSYSTYFTYLGGRKLASGAGCGNA